MVLPSTKQETKGGRLARGGDTSHRNGKRGEREEEEEEEEIGMAMLVRVSGGVYGSEKSAILL